MRRIAIWVVLSLGAAGCSGGSSSDSTGGYNVNGYQRSNPAPLPDKPVVKTQSGEQKSPAAGLDATPPKAPVEPPQSNDKPSADLKARIAKLGLGPQVPQPAELIQLPKEYAAKIDLNAIRKALFDQINKDRAAAGLNKLYYDSIAENAGNLQTSREVAAGHMLGHFSTNGDLPYMRYSEVGGYDSEAENWASGAVFFNSMSTQIADSPDVTKGKCSSPLFNPPTPDSTQNLLQTLAMHLHCGMLNEVPGHDGHRKAILDPHRTSVGIGVGVAIVTEADSSTPKLRLFMTEEFTNRVLTVKQGLPLAISLRQPPNVKFVATIPDGFQFDQMMFFYEQRKTLTPDQAFGVNHYSLPDLFQLFLPELPSGSRYSDDTYRTYPDLQATASVQSNSLQIPLVFKRGAGVYTMVVWLRGQNSRDVQQVTSRSIFAFE